MDKKYTIVCCWVLSWKFGYICFENRRNLAALQNVRLFELFWNTVFFNEIWKVLNHDISSKIGLSMYYFKNCFIRALVKDSICSGVLLWLLVFCWYSLEQMQLEAIGAKQKKMCGRSEFWWWTLNRAQHEAGAFRGCPVIISQSTFEVSKIELTVHFH